MRVAFIARYLQMVNHRKVMALAAQPGVELWHVAPRRWVDSFRSYQHELLEGRGYRLMLADAFPLRGDIHRFVYWPPTLFLNVIQPDIIHVEEEPDSLVALEVIVARRLWAPRARLVLFTWQNVRRARRTAVERLARWVLRRIDHAIAGNCEAVDVLRAQGYTGPVTVLPQLGVDTKVFKPCNASALRRELGLEGFVIGFAGRFVPEKGLETLTRAAAQAPGSRLLLIGRGPIQAEIESLARQLGLSERLVVVGSVPHHDVPRYLNAMDVFILPSQTTPSWKEQFGHVLIEAMACGVPVIGSSSGAIPEVIGDAGLVFPESDANALAACVRRLANDHGERSRLSQAGLQRVAERYTHEGIAEQTAQIYHAVLAR